MTRTGWRAGFGAIALSTALTSSASAAPPGYAWIGEIDQPGAGYGRAIATAGDVDGDGFDDLVLGYSEHSNGQLREGAIALYLGSAAGPSAAPDQLAESNQRNAAMGSSVAAAGDVDGDGYDDVVAGGPGCSRGQANEGCAYLFHGSAAGLASTPGWTAESDLSGASFGSTVAGAGDVNGDGYDDVAVGADLYSGGQSQEGAVYVYLGSAAGLQPVYAWQVETNQASAHLGQAISSGDVNGDGFDDLVVGATGFSNGQVREGMAAAYLGGPAGLASTPAWMVESNQPGAHLGASVAANGDVNGDGYDDVLVGIPNTSDGQQYEGAAALYLGSAAGPSATPARTVQSNEWWAFLGSSVAFAGDVDGDGFDDAVVGAPQYEDGHTGEGGVALFLGTAAGLTAAPVVTVEANQGPGGPYSQYAALGSIVAGAGDVNGDGLGDVVVGAPGYDHGQTDEGAAFLYLGR